MFLRFLTSLGLLWVLIGSSSAMADQYRVLNEGPEALQARIDLIEQAKKSIDFAYYAWGDDAIARQVLALLREASRERGVKVRILVDGSFNDIPAATRLHLASEGITVKDYFPFRILRPRTWVHSMHNKLMIVDGTTMIVGGRNMVAGYFGFPAPEEFHDRDAILRGEATTTAQTYFDSLWRSPYVSIEIGRLHGQTPKGAGERLDRAWEALHEDPVLRTGTETDWFAGVPESAAATFLHDRLRPSKKSKPVHRELIALMNAAKKSIVIEVAYILVTNDLMNTFRKALKRGVKIRLLTNSMQSNDVSFAQAGYLSRRRKLIRMGIEVWEYLGSTTLHVKSAVIDEKIAIIGSYNLDLFSERLNAETVSYIEDEAIADEVRAAMDANLESAAKIDRRGFPEHASRRFPGVPWGYVLKTQLLRYIGVPLLRGLL